MTMVYLVQLAQGLSETGARKALPGSRTFESMVRDVVSRRKLDLLVALYCADGAVRSWDPMSSVEAKVLEDLIRCICPDVMIDARKFSFHADDALRLLQEADVFYFKGFGGDSQLLLPNFGESVSEEMARRVLQFQNKCMFSGVLAIMVCGAAVLTGTHYPGQALFKGLQLLGDAYVHYHACERTTSLVASTSNDTIQLAPGIANIIRCEVGQLECEAVNVARSSKDAYEQFRAQSELHLTAVMQQQRGLWRTYYFYDHSGRAFLWKSRTDGKILILPLYTHMNERTIDEIKQYDWQSLQQLEFDFLEFDFLRRL